MLAIAATAVVSVAAVASAPGSGPSSPRGGTYRVGWEPGSFDGLDPTIDDFTNAGIESNLLLRTLVGYDHVSGPAGTKLVPDLATAVPAPTNGGRTYTFTLKRGIRFGPPVDREITSNDVRFAIERLARPRNDAFFSALYPVYFAVVEGFTRYRAGHARSIPGIATPNARTISFTLTRPVGDFLKRLALPAAAPIPSEVGRCFEGKPGKYGADLISSGPYMIDGADRVKLGSCSSLEPMRGITANQLTLVRNPRYDPRTDSHDARESNPDRFVFVASIGRGGARNVVAMVDAVAAGELDDAAVSSTKAVLKHAARTGRRDLLRANAAHWLAYISLNLTQPPFDDVHVRRALSWLVDKAALRDAAWGGPLAGTIAEHLVPDDLLGDQLQDFAPFKTRGDRGDLRRARAEMGKSKYATRRGVCVAKACKHVFAVPLYDCPCYAAGQQIALNLVASATRIGIVLRLHSRDWALSLRPAKNFPILLNSERIYDYPDAAEAIAPVFGGVAILPAGNWNTSLLGLTPARAATLGVKGRVAHVPSVDDAIVRCDSLDGTARIACYASLDRVLSADIVPWIPLLWRNRIDAVGAQVAKWEFDQSTGMTSFAHVALKR